MKKKNIIFLALLISVLTVCNVFAQSSKEKIAERLDYYNKTCEMLEADYVQLNNVVEEKEEYILLSTDDRSIGCKIICDEGSVTAASEIQIYNAVAEGNAQNITTMLMMLYTNFIRDISENDMSADYFQWVTENENNMESIMSGELEVHEVFTDASYADFCLDTSTDSNGIVCFTGKIVFKNTDADHDTSDITEAEVQPEEASDTSDKPEAEGESDDLENKILTALSSPEALVDCFNSIVQSSSEEYILMIESQENNTVRAISKSGDVAINISTKEDGESVETINVTGIYPSVSSYFEALNDSALLIKIATRADTRFEAFEPWFTSNVVAVNKAQMNQENYQSVFEEEGISMILGNINIPGSETQESINFLYSEITFPEGD